MAKERIVNTRFWDDTYIVTLDPIEKLLYPYFLTNPLTNICGVYEVPLRRVAFDTGIDKDMIEKIIKRFSVDNKIYYAHGWIAIRNFAKHQKDNPKVKKGIQIALKLIPEAIINTLYIDYQYSIDTLSHSNSNSNSNLNSNSNSKDIAPAEAVAVPVSEEKGKKAEKPKKPKAIDDQTPYTLQEFVDTMLKSPQRHIQIIGEYADEIKPDFNTKGQWEVFKTRNLRAARSLSPYTKDQIGEAFQRIEENKKTANNPRGYITRWTLETLLDYLHQ